MLASLEELKKNVNKYKADFSKEADAKLIERNLTDLVVISLVILLDITLAMNMSFFEI